MSVVQLPKFPLLGFEHLDPEQAAELLHQKKNRPDQPIDIDRFVRPYGSLTTEEKAFPTAMYREWDVDDKQKAILKASRKFLWNLKDPVDYEQAEQFVGAYDSRLANSALEQVILLGQGWANTPADAKHLAFMAHRATFEDAAVSNTTDRRTLSEKALIERDAAEDAAPDHIAEIPRKPLPPKGAKVNV